MPPGASADRIDCDDTDPLVFQGADERADGKDGNCDGDATDAGIVST